MSNSIIGERRWFIDGEVITKGFTPGNVLMVLGETKKLGFL
jgi:hypothetical protein